MKNLNIKKHFTLLELMICIALITICFSMIGINVRKAINIHKYKSNIKKIDMYFDFCKKMAMANQADVYLNFSQVNQNIFCEMGTDENRSFFENSQKIRDNFENMYFFFDKKKINKLEILFSSTGEILPKGEIEFSTNDKIEFSDKNNYFKQFKTI